MNDSNLSRQGLLEKSLVVFLAAGIVSGVNAEDPPTNLPPVEVVGVRGGGFIICYGYDCADALDGLSRTPPLFPLEYEYLSPDAGGEVDRGEFCEALKDKKPSSCDAANPPSTPDTDPNWMPNGCGTSAGIQIAMQAGINQLVPDQFSGDYGSPYAGVSFTAACNTHDRCYGLGFDKGNCDLDFRDNMIDACGVSANVDYNVCTGLAGIYHGAVASTTFGQDAYQQAASEHTCAVWAKDMEGNGCDS